MPRNPDPARHMRYEALVKKIADTLVIAASGGYEVGELLGNAIGQAANRAGGADALIAQRPGSWESALIAQFAHTYADTSHGGLLPPAEPPAY
jgi:hypothetical protein